MMYHLLLIDLDDTLLSFHEDARSAIAKTWEALSLPKVEHLYARYEAYNAPLWKELEKGKLTPKDIQRIRFVRLLEELGSGADPLFVNQVYLEHLAKEAFLFEGVHETLAKLSKKYNCILASNGIASVQRGRLKEADLNQYFSHSILSEDVGASKPSPDFFVRGLKDFPAISPEKVLMIGDSLTSDIQGAANMGYDACWVNATKKERPPGLPIHYEVENFQSVGRFL